MKNMVGVLALMLLVVPVALGATLELRLVESDSIEVGKEAAFEIVLTAEAGENINTANIFLNVNDDALIELINFEAGNTVPSEVNYTRNYLENGTQLPLAEGEGVSIEDYSLNAGDEISGGTLFSEVPGEIVLERITFIPSATGTVEIEFEEGLRDPEFYDLSDGFEEFALADPGTTGAETDVIVLGTGDGRTGGVGPLEFTISEAGGNANDNTNGGNQQPQRFCAFGSLPGLLFCFFGLGAMRLGRRQ